MAGSDLYEITIEGSINPLTGALDSRYILPRTLIVPKNSGIQVVYSKIMRSIERAKRFKPPFREYAIALARSNLEGIISISSELGAFVREFNTSRSSVPVGGIQGQPASWMDEYVYGKDALKHNPKTNKLGIEM